VTLGIVMRQPHHRSMTRVVKDLTVLSAHPHVYPRMEWTILAEASPHFIYLGRMENWPRHCSGEDHKVADIAVVSCSRRHASLGKWAYAMPVAISPR